MGFIKSLLLLTILMVAVSYSQSAYGGVACNKNTSELQCLVCNCYFESKGEKFAGKIAVNITVHARVNSKKFPNSICSVVYQPNQFSWVNDKYSNTITHIIDGKFNPADKQAYRDCETAASKTTPHATNFRNPTYFFNPKKVRPSWAKKFTHAYTVGNHAFYSDPTEPVMRAPSWSDFTNGFKSITSFSLPAIPKLHQYSGNQSAAGATN